MHMVLAMMSLLVVTLSSYNSYRLMAELWKAQGAGSTGLGGHISVPLERSEGFSDNHITDLSLISSVVCGFVCLFLLCFFETEFLGVALAVLEFAR